MKPIKLKIKGLNSFIEEQTIDFEKLTDRGFFGIFGPTGSGKSTILDGITLALYGNVSRKSSNYINTNCDRLNVSFEFQISGAEVKRYVVDREFRRKNDGSINSGKCKIVDITNGEEVLADGFKSINKKAEEIIGLNLEDFTRTVVLPQGKFSEFLKLTGTDRRDMLERLFNLEQYGDDLSGKLKAKIIKEKTENSVLTGKLSGYSDISEEKLKEKELVFSELNSKLVVLKNELEAIENEYKENEGIWKLQLELIECRGKEKLLKEREEEIKAYDEKIKLGEAGAKVVPYINAFEDTIKEFNKNQTDLERLKQAIEKIKVEKEKIEELWKAAKDKKENKIPELMLNEQKIKDAIEEKKSIELIAVKIKSLKEEISKLEISSTNNQNEIMKIESETKDRIEDIKLNEKKYEEIKIDENIKEKVQQGILAEEKYKRLNLLIGNDQKKKENLEKENEDTITKGKALKEVIEKMNKSREENKNQQEELLKNPPGDQDALVNFSQLLAENEQKYNAFDRLNEEINSAKNEIQILNSVVIKEKEEVQKHEKELEKLKYAQKEIMKENLAHTLREELKDGEICPVCGSTHHIKENIKIIEAVDLNEIEAEIKNKEILIKDINNKIIEGETKAANFKEKIKVNEEEIKKLGTKFKEKPLETLKEEFIKLKTDMDNYGKQKEKLEKNINDLENQINIKNGEINELRAIVKTKQKQLKDLEDSLKTNTEEAANLENELNLLRSETGIEDFNKKNEEIKIIEKEREKLAELIKDSRQLLEGLENKKKILNDELTSIKEKLAKHNADLNANEKNKEEKLQSIKNKVNEEKDLDLLLVKVQREIKIINEDFKKFEESKNKTEKEFSDYNEALIGAISKDKDLSKRRKEQEDQLEAAIDSEGFNSLEEVKKNLIDKKQLSEYRELVSSYKENISKLTGTIENLSSKIKGRELTEETYEKVRNLKVEKEKEVNEFNENKIKVDEELKNIKEKLKEQKEFLEKKKELEHKLALLDDLEKLFKAKKFVEFVAANKLKYVSIEASKRLKEISGGNYGLEVDENGRFIIRDYKNGGACRDASTLSGGETFLASLSLALALSAQIQLKGTAPLELFFLDEGFGTLDDDLLEVVMSSLEKIHNDKLKVGIISHVEAIKNRVPVKLMITPAEAGMGGSKVKIERS